MLILSQVPFIEVKDKPRKALYVNHNRHSTSYAYNLYANSQTMVLLARSNNAAPFLIYGMDLTQGFSLDLR